MFASAISGLGLLGCVACFFSGGEGSLTGLVAWFVRFRRRKEGWPQVGGEVWPRLSHKLTPQEERCVPWFVPIVSGAVPVRSDKTSTDFRGQAWRIVHRFQVPHPVNNQRSSIHNFFPNGNSKKKTRQEALHSPWNAPGNNGNDNRKHIVRWFYRVYPSIKLDQSAPLFPTSLTAQNVWLNSKYCRQLKLIRHYQPNAVKWLYEEFRRNSDKAVWRLHDVLKAFIDDHCEVVAPSLVRNRLTNVSVESLDGLSNG